MTIYNRGLFESPFGFNEFTIFFFCPDCDVRWEVYVDDFDIPIQPDQDFCPYCSRLGLEEVA